MHDGLPAGSHVMVDIPANRYVAGNLHTIEATACGMFRGTQEVAKVIRALAGNEESCLIGRLPRRDGGSLS